MPNNIKPSEVSDVLLRQLENIDTNIKFEEVGIVLSIGDGVARIYGLTGVTENELIEFDNGVMAVAMNLEEDNGVTSRVVCSLPLLPSAQMSETSIYKSVTSYGYRYRFNSLCQSSFAICNGKS